MIHEGTIAAVGGIQALLLTSLLLSKKQRNSADALLGGFMLLLALHLTYYYTAGSLAVRLPIEAHALGASLVLLHTPLFFLYLRALVQPGQGAVTALQLLVHLLPYLLYNAILLTGWQLGWLELVPNKGYLGVASAYGVFQAHGLVLAVVPVAYMAWGFQMYSRYCRLLPAQASQLGSRLWVGFLVWGFLGYFVAIFVTVSLADRPLRLIPQQYTFYIVSVVVMAFILVLGYVGLRQPRVFLPLVAPPPGPPPSPAPKPEAPAKYARSGLSQEQINAHKQQLAQQMQAGQYYLQPNLTLAQLANATALSPTYLSQVINQGFGQNFYDFVNTFRIKAAQQLLASPRHAHLTVLAIALDCGFQSKSTFNKAFKKVTGTTPSAYRLAPDSSSAKAGTE